MKGRTMQHISSFQRKQRTHDPSAPVSSAFETRPFSDLSTLPQQYAAPVAQYKYHIGNIRIHRRDDDKIKSPHRPQGASSFSSEESQVAQKRPSTSAIQTRASSDLATLPQQHAAPVAQYKFHIGNIRTLGPDNGEMKSPPMQLKASSLSSVQRQARTWRRRDEDEVLLPTYEEALNDTVIDSAPNPNQYAHGPQGGYNPYPTPAYYYLHGQQPPLGSNYQQGPQGGYNMYPAPGYNNQQGGYGRPYYEYAHGQGGYNMYPAPGYNSQQGVHGPYYEYAYGQVSNPKKKKKGLFRSAKKFLGHVLDGAAIWW
jgi:hypothetical protein